MKRTVTKRSLLTSVMSLFLCFAMLLGTTYAWFTDTASSKGNKVQAGTLDVELLMWDGSKYVNISTSEDPIFDSAANANNSTKTLWEPGKTQVAYLAIANEGNLDLKYSVALNVTNITKNLNEVMEYTITPDAKDGAAVAWDANAAQQVVAGIQTVTASDTTLQAKENGVNIHYFALSIHMMEEAGNEYKGGEITFDLNVLATQVNTEEDAYGPDYDKDALIISPVISLPAAVTEPLTVASTGGVKVTLSEAALNEMKNEGVTEISVTHSAPKAESNGTLVFDTFEVVDQNGNAVEVDGTVTLPVDTIADGTLVAVYHDDDLMAMPEVANGTITYTYTHNSEVRVVPVVKVGTADELKAAIANGGYVQLTADIELTKTLMAQKDVVIDLNGHTVTANMSQDTLFQSQSNAAPSMTITSSKSGAKINAGGKSVLLGYGSTEFSNVEINVDEIKSSSYTTFKVYGDLTLGEGTVVNVKYLGTSLISNNGSVDIVIDGAKINVGTYKTNGGAMISLTSGTTLALNDTEVKVGLDTTYTSYFISKAENTTIENCTFDITDANGEIYDIKFKPDANVGAKYTWAVIPGEKVGTADELVAAIANGGTVVLVSDVVVDQTVTIPKGVTVTLNLNGHNLSYAVSNSGASAIITNYGDLTIEGKGNISFVAANPDLGKIPAYATNTITNEATLTIKEGVVVENGSDGGASYAVDNKGVFTLDGGTLIGKRCALRIAKYNQDNVVFIMNSGLVKGATPAWIQLPGGDSKVAPTITVTINGGTFETTKESSEDNNVLYTYSYGNSHANTTVNIKGGEFLGGVVSIGSGYKGDAPTLNITGGTFEYDVYQWLENDEWKVLYEANK